MIRFLVVVALFICFAVPGWCEEVSISSAAVTFDAPFSDTLDLGYRFILPNTVRLESAGELLAEGVDYSVNYDKGIVTIYKPEKYTNPITASFMYLPYFQGDSFEQIMEGADEAAALERLRDGDGNSSFDVTGSKTFSISAGSDDAVDLEQSLRLSLQGKVGDDTRIRAELSDQTIPLEGGQSTQELAELDRVYVNVEGRHYGATFGDVEINKTGRRYASFERKLAGLIGELHYPQYDIEAGIAQNKGRFGSVEFTGSDGVQGPYQLSVGGDEDIIILAGTERVYIDGVLLKPGNNNDYILDNDMARITFENRVIDSGDRIVVEFEYVTENYRRSFWEGEAGLHLFDDKLTASVLYITEGDSIKEPPFDPTKQELYDLINAGDDEERAFTVVTDEDGNTVYEFVGDGNGDYERVWDENIGAYIYTLVGEGNGDFTPRRVKLPLPSRHSITDILISATPFDLLTFSGEVAMSERDANLYSDAADDDNTGTAGTGKLAFNIHRADWFAEKFTNLTLSVYGASRHSYFNSIAAADGAGFSYDWDIAAENAALSHYPGYDEYGTGLELAIAPLMSTIDVGRLDLHYREPSASDYENLTLDRIKFSTKLDKNPIARLDYKLNDIRKTGTVAVVLSEIDNSGQTKNRGRFREQSGEIRRRIWIVEPFAIGGEKLNETDEGDDGILDTGERKLSAGGGATLYPIPMLTLTGSRSFMWGDTISEGAFAREYNTTEDFASFSYDKPGLLNLFGNYTHTNKDYIIATTSDVLSDVGNLDIIYTPLKRSLSTRVAYNIKSRQDFEQEEYYERAEDGDGDYRQETDPENPSRYIYIYDPDHPEAYYFKKYRNTGLVTRTVEAGITSNFYIEPYRLIDAEKAKTGSAFWYKLFAADIFFRINERSAGDDRTAVLTFQKRMDDDTTSGIFEQSYKLKVLPINPKINGNLRLRDTKSLDRTLSYSNLLRKRRIYNAEVSSEPMSSLSVTAGVEYLTETENEIEENSEPNDKIADETTITVEPGYKLIEPWEVKLEGSYAKRNELNNARPTEISTRRIKPSTTYRLPNSGIITAYYEMEDNEVTGSYGSRTLLSRLPGIIHKWQTKVTKGVGEYVTIIFSYDGLKEPDDDTEHRGRIDLNIVF